jgi:predicted ATPase
VVYPQFYGLAKENYTTRTKTPVRLSLSIQTDNINYEIACGLPAPTLSKFGLDPEVKEETIWVGETKRPSNTILERQATRAWITNQYGKREPYPATLSQSESVLSQLQDPHLYPELFALSDEIKKWRFYHHFRTDPDSPIRAPQIGVRTTVLSNDGHDLAAALQTIIEIGSWHK